MKHAKEIDNRVGTFFHNLYLSYIPNKRDNIKQIILKVFFIIAFIALIISASYLANYFISSKKQDNIIDNTRELWHNSVNLDKPQESVDTFTKLETENSDFKGWLSMPAAGVDHPVYQTTDNDFYLKHNQQKKRSAYGALFIDSNNTVTEKERDKNIVIYGHNMKNGSMFGSLKRVRQLDFYKKNPTFKFTTKNQTTTYKIYAVILLNASKADDNGYIYNIYRKSFNDEADFNAWRDEGLERSMINTGVDVNINDNIMTLITCANDFDNARLILMARELREGETEAIDASAAKINPSPRYPKRWYDDRNREYPFE